MTQFRIPFDDDDQLDRISKWMMENTGEPWRQHDTYVGRIGRGWSAVWTYCPDLHCKVEIEDKDIATLFALRWA